MSKLTDRDILTYVKSGHIKINPFDLKALGTNSYDVHLADTLLTYVIEPDEAGVRTLDCRKSNTTIEHNIGPEGFVLRPGVLYLASTVEYTESREHVPHINGKSSLGRLGLMVHITAGTGDVGFCGHWTLELAVIEPLRVYAGMPVAQLMWDTIHSPPIIPYGKKKTAKYTDATKPVPQSSRMHRNFSGEGNPSDG
jgi:dCTP deaminase